LNNLKIHCIIFIIIQTERVAKLENEKEEPKTINNMHNKAPGDIKINENDSIEVNNLLTLTDADVSSDLLEQLEAKAKQEQELLEKDKAETAIENTPDIQMQTGFPADLNGAISITSEIIEKPKVEEMDPVEEAELNAKFKKYVIYINKDNEKYLDDLSIKERKELINHIIHTQKTITEEEKLEKEKHDRQTKLIVSTITFIVAVPLIYFLFNISMQATIQNYKQSRSNFEVLYKNSGKIKINE